MRADGIIVYAQVKVNGSTSGRTLVYAATRARRRNRRLRWGTRGQRAGQLLQPTLRRRHRCGAEGWAATTAVVHQAAARADSKHAEPRASAAS
jgi:hypothetical protein